MNHDWKYDRRADLYWTENPGPDRGTWYIEPRYGDEWADVANGDAVTHYMVMLAFPWEDPRDAHTRAATWRRAVVRTADEGILLIESGDIDKIAERVLTWDYNCPPGCCAP